MKAESGLVLFQLALCSGVIFSAFSSYIVPRTICLGMTIALAPVALNRLRLLTGFLPYYPVPADNRYALYLVIVLRLFEVNEPHIKRKRGYLVSRGIDPYNVMSFVLEGCDDILRWDSVVNVAHDYFVGSVLR